MLIQLYKITFFVNKISCSKFGKCFGRQKGTYFNFVLVKILKIFLFLNIKVKSYGQ